VLVKANTMALKAGYNFADTLEIINEPYIIKPAPIAEGNYRQINGNTATAWGFLCAAEKSGLELFLGSYPITPATDILHELATHKYLGVKTFQAEDEIAAICGAIGASFSGDLALTTSSGIALKGEALNLAVMLELPLVVVNVQRGGPSTGLPTKTEQSDLQQALYGRNGDSPIIVVAARSPSDCFKMAYEASRLSIEHMTPVILLTDGYIANGSEPWKIPDTDDASEYPDIAIQKATSEQQIDGKFLPYMRDAKTLARKWATPGMEGFEHRLGGLEKQVDTGNVSYDPVNHQIMTNLRHDKVENVKNFIPRQELLGKENGDVLLISWGGTYGATHSAVSQLIEAGKSVAHMHMNYINPMPKNTEELIKGFKKIVVAELNCGQLKDVINARFSCDAKGYNKVQGLPFKIRELTGMLYKELEQL
jgi:2-oxoglutarate ferredoxin oxidoreductase subunit alpha